MFLLFSQQLSQLHFQAPLWLLALIPLGLLLWLLSRTQVNASAWAKVIDPKLLPYLLQGEQGKTSSLPKWLMASAGLIGIIALADPVWEKVPRPVFQTNAARVIVLDLSTSMLVDDLKPSRLARARFKIEDILSREEEGQTGLVVFAGDAFTASPLTRDVDTIRNLLQVFTPEIMPAQGSRVDYALQKAHELLKQAGIQHGQVLLIADGASNPKAAYKAAKALRDDGHTVSVLAVGTKQGGLLRLRSRRVNVKLDADILQKIAKTGGGGYHLISSNNSDLNTVLKQTLSDKKQDQAAAKTDDFKTADWKSSGPYLVLLLLPLAALAFRKGWLLNLFIVAALFGLGAQPQNLYAAASSAASAASTANSNEATNTNQNNQSTISELWQKLWLNKEQRAAKALQQKQFKRASQLSQAPLRKGSAEFKGNDYEGALSDFQKAQGADARYNEGNALAKLKKYKEAIEAYKKALKLNPDMADAKANKKALEDFLKRQQQKKQQQKHKKQDKNKQGQNKKDQNRQQQNQNQKKNQQQNQQQDQQQGGKKQQDQQSARQDKDKQGKQGKKDAQNKNQFADANKNLDKNKDKKDQPNDSEQASKGADKDQKKADREKSKAQKEAQKKAQREAQQKQQAAKEKAGKAQDKKPDEAQQAARAKAEELSKEEKMAAEQWLRRIPDDPGGLLRRKFRRQYQRSNRRPNDDEQPW